MYAKLFQENCCNGSFSVILVKENELANIKQLVRQYELDAFAVTMPHKRSMIYHLDEISEEAEKLQSVNFAVCKDGKLFGYNTDGDGLLRMLGDNEIAVSGKRVLIYGYGGAASAAAYALACAGAQISVTGRNREKYKAFAEHFQISHTDSLDLSDCDIFINATPLGMRGNDNFTRLDFIDSATNTVILDMIYDPQETELLKKARSRGLIAINGIGMLENQARIAFGIAKNVCHTNSL